jgi:hypothetical protein
VLPCCVDDEEEDDCEGGLGDEGCCVGMDDGEVGADWGCDWGC